VIGLFAAVVADHWDGDHMGGSIGMWWWWLIVLLALGALVAAVAVLLARGARHEPGTDAAGRARAIAMERYARGEIDGDEFTDIETRLR
jgi:uncharacterized membrane protein